MIDIVSLYYTSSMACLTPSVESSNHYQFSSLHDSCSEATARTTGYTAYKYSSYYRTN